MSFDIRPSDAINIAVRCKVISLCEFNHVNTSSFVVYYILLFLCLVVVDFCPENKCNCSAKFHR
jgi:hypothetical protein